MVLLPDLTETPFNRIEVVVSVPFDRLSESDHESLQCGPWSQYGLFEVQIDGDKEPRQFWELKYDEDEFLRARVTISTEAARPDPLWDRGVWKDSSGVENPLEFFKDRESRFCLRALFSIERIRVPPHSLISSMIGLRTIAGEEHFLLSGAQFSVRGFPGDTVSWYLSPGTAGTEVAGEIVRHHDGVLRPESIIDATHVAQSRFNRVVLAQSDVSLHAIA